MKEGNTEEHYSDDALEFDNILIEERIKNHKKLVQIYTEKRELVKDRFNKEQLDLIDFIIEEHLNSQIALEAQQHKL